MSKGVRLYRGKIAGNYTSRPTKSLEKLSIAAARTAECLEICRRPRFRISYPKARNYHRRWCATRAGSDPDIGHFGSIRIHDRYSRVDGVSSNPVDKRYRQICSLTGSPNLGNPVDDLV